MGHDGQRPSAVFDGERPAQGLVVPAVHVTVDQPSMANRATIPPGQPSPAESLSITTVVSWSILARPAYWMASALLPSSSSASPTRTTTCGVGRPVSRSPSAVPTANPKPWPSEPELISTPGTSVPSGWNPSGESNAPNPSRSVGVRNPCAASTA